MNTSTVVAVPTLVKPTTGRSIGMGIADVISPDSGGFVTGLVHGYEMFDNPELVALRSARIAHDDAVALAYFKAKLAV